MIERRAFAPMSDISFLGELARKGGSFWWCTHQPRHTKGGCWSRSSHRSWCQIQSVDEDVSSFGVHTKNAHTQRHQQIHIGSDVALCSERGAFLCSSIAKLLLQSWNASALGIVWCTAPATRTPDSGDSFHQRGEHVTMSLQYLSLAFFRWQSNVA